MGGHRLSHLPVLETHRVRKHCQQTSVKREKVTTEYLSAITKGVQHKVNFLLRTTPDQEKTLQNTETLFTTKLIPNIIGRGPPSVTERSLFSLPLSKGGLKILSPEDRRNNLQWSKAVTAHLDVEDLDAGNIKMLNAYQDL